MYQCALKTQIACKWVEISSFLIRLFSPRIPQQAGHVLPPHSIVANSAIDSRCCALIHYQMLEIDQCAEDSPVGNEVKAQSANFKAYDILSGSVSISVLACTNKQEDSCLFVCDMVAVKKNHFFLSSILLFPTNTDLSVHLQHFKPISHSLHTCLMSSRGT